MRCTIHGKVRASVYNAQHTLCGLLAQPPMQQNGIVNEGAPSTAPLHSCGVTGGIIPESLPCRAFFLGCFCIMRLVLMSLA